MSYKVLGNSIPIIDDSRNILNANAVGIGTTNPTSKLWVDGDGYFTGVTTASRFVSTVAQGTAPLTVTSTTLVSNLNLHTCAVAVMYSRLIKRLSSQTLSVCLKSLANSLCIPLVM